MAKLTSLEDLIDKMRQQMAAMNQLLDSMPGEQRSQLEEMMRNLAQDPGLQEARSAVDIPVVGYGETSMLTARMLGGSVAFEEPDRGTKIVLVAPLHMLRPSKEKRAAAG